MLKKNKKNIVFQIITIILTIILVLNIGICIFAFFVQNEKREKDPDEFIYSLKNQSYCYLMQECYSMDLDEVKKDPELYEFYCIAKYFENASLYKTYFDNDDEKTQKYKQNMDVYAQGIVTFDYTIEEINEIFDIDE